MTIEVLSIAAGMVQGFQSSSPAKSIIDWTGCQDIRSTSTFFLGWALLTVGVLIRVTCYREMGKHFTFEITIRKDHRLVTSGPYSVVRHPAYSAVCLIAAGTALCLLGPGSWLLECGVLNNWVGKAFVLIWLSDLIYPPFVMVVLRIKAEDEILKKTFGREWEEWARRTPYALIPGIY